MSTSAATRRKPSARKSSTRTEALVHSARHGAAWLAIWHVVVVWRDHTWPVAQTAVSAITAMATSVL